MPDVLVVGDGGERLRRCLAVFAHVMLRTRPATAVPSTNPALIPLTPLYSSYVPNFQGHLTLSEGYRRRISLPRTKSGAQLNPLLLLWHQSTSILGTLRLAGQ